MLQLPSCAIAPSICSVFRTTGAHGPPPLSAHLLDDAAVSWDFCCSAQIANKGTPKSGEMTGPGFAVCIQRQDDV